MLSHAREMFDDGLLSKTSWRLMESVLNESEVNVECNIGKVRMLRERSNFIAQTVCTEPLI